MTCDLSMDTVGKISSDLIVKEPETKSPIEQMRENLTDYEKNMHECVARGKKDIHGDFYIEVITKKEPLMQNVIRNYFGFRHSCPTPNYDHAVYKYTLENDHLEFLWVIPDRQTCQLMIENKIYVPLEEHGLLDYVMRFANGELFTLCKTLNGEPL
jgi:hypothetical protein